MSGLGAFLALILIVFSATASAQQQDNNSGSPAASDESQVMQSFTSQEDVESGLVSIDDKRKRQIMFAMGIPLLLFIMITVALGIAMGVFGKEVYVAHMIFAGLSLTLAFGHAIVGLVWFWPF
ncbi:MAG: hypothetical protein PVH98_03755 [Gammaproteobacteria bacterium]